MMQERGFPEASSIALSSSGLYGTTRFTSMPHEAETISVGSAWLMRAASSCDASGVDQRGLAGAALLDVPIERVVARVDPAARKPAVKRGARAVEHAIPMLVPVDGFAGFGPEPFRVLGPLRVDLVLDALRGVEAGRGVHGAKAATPTACAATPAHATPRARRRARSTPRPAPPRGASRSARRGRPPGRRRAAPAPRRRTRRTPSPGRAARPARSSES